jgi:hypothetical protein
MTYKHVGTSTGRMSGSKFVDTYHVDGFQELGLCDSGSGAHSAIVGAWSEVLKYEEKISCPQCQALIALVKGNQLEIDFDRSYSDSPLDEAYAQLEAPPPLKVRLEGLLK